jgi:hypothetical protein
MPGRTPTRRPIRQSTTRTTKFAQFRARRIHATGGKDIPEYRQPWEYKSRRAESPHQRRTAECLPANSPCHRRDNQNIIIAPVGEVHAHSIRMRSGKQEQQHRGRSQRHSRFEFASNSRTRAHPICYRRVPMRVFRCTQVHVLTEARRFTRTLERPLRDRVSGPT